MTKSVPSLLCLEAPEAAPWMFSEAWLMVFLIEWAVSEAAGSKVGQGQGNDVAYLIVSIVDVGGCSDRILFEVWWIDICFEVLFEVLLDA